MVGGVGGMRNSPLHLISLFCISVKCPGEVPTLPVLFLGFPLVPLKSTFVHLARQIEYVSSNGRLTGI